MINFFLRISTVIALTWEQPSYTFFESLTDESSLFGLFDPPVLIKQNETFTEYLLVIFAQVYKVLNAAAMFEKFSNIVSSRLSVITSTFTWVALAVYIEV